MIDILDKLKQFEKDTTINNYGDEIYISVPAYVFAHSDSENIPYCLTISKDNKTNEYILSDSGQLFLLLNDYDFEFTQEELDESIIETQKYFDFTMNGYAIQLRTTKEKFLQSINYYISIINYFSLLFMRYM